MIDLHQGARPDERFHLQYGQPSPRWFGVRWLVRRTSWSSIYRPDGSNAKWVSWVILWGLHFYHGTAKCDGTRTAAYWYHQFGDPVSYDNYVMTTTPKEMLAFRWRCAGMDKTPKWSNMGGA